jgi:hypothetical protein
MPDDKLTPTATEDLAAALAFALRFAGRKRTHNADEIMAEIVAKRLVEHLERAGFVMLKRPNRGSAPPIGLLGRRRCLAMSTNGGGKLSHHGRTKKTGLREVNIVMQCRPQSYKSYVRVSIIARRSATQRMDA